MNLKSLSDAAEAFSKFEDETCIYSLDIQGVPVWEIIRYHTFQSLCVKAGIIELGHPHTPKNLKTILDYSSNIIKSALSRKLDRSLNNYYDAIVLGHPRLLMDASSKYEDPYSESYLNHTSLSYCYLERAFRGSYFKPRRPGNHILTDDVALLSSRIKSRLTVVDRKRLVELEKQLYQFTGCSISFCEYVSSFLGKRSVLVPFYERLIKKYRPKVGITVIGYLNPVFIEACKNNNLPVVEIQHGVISRYHFGYHHNVSSPSFYYPDQLWLWGDYWKSAANYPEKTQLKSVGFPLFERFRRQHNSYKRSSCIFISQGSVGNRIADSARSLRKIDQGLEIFYRLHPSEYDSWEMKYSDLPEKGIKIIGSGDGTIYDWFKKTKYVIGGYSTALFEAAGMGCKVGVLNQPGIEYMEPLIEKRGAMKINSSFGDFFDDDAGVAITGDTIFKPYTPERTTTLLDDILSR